MTEIEALFKYISYMYFVLHVAVLTWLVLVCLKAVAFGLEGNTSITNTLV